MIKSLIAATLLTASLGLGGCVISPVECTDLAAVSVSLTLENQNGESVAGADVRFSADGSAEEPCTEFDVGTYTCGYEVEGELTITIGADGYEPASISVTVGADECHVITEEVTVVLVPAAQPA